METYCSTCIQKIKTNFGGRNNGMSDKGVRLLYYIHNGNVYDASVTVVKLFRVGMCAVHRWELNSSHCDCYD